MPSTYTPITTTTLSSATSTVTLSSIPSTYTDLVLVVNYWSTGSYSDSVIRFNSDSGTNYSSTQIWGPNGSSTYTQRFSGVSSIYLPTTSNTSGGSMALINVMNYANTSIYKTAGVNANDLVNGRKYLNIGLWRNTAAINSITITATNSVNYAVGSTFTLYGIKAA